MNLAGKTALIFCGSGAIASGVAEAMARDGAHVFISARRKSSLDELARTI